MKYDEIKLYKTFEKVKSQKEFTDYCVEMEKIVSILDSNPFEKCSATKQVNSLTAKYRSELNFLANFYGNKMYVEIVPNEKESDQDQLKDELKYIYSQIPIIAFLREWSKEVVDELFGIV